HRLPHAWLARGEDQISTLDIGGRGQFLLLTAPAGNAWQLAAREASKATGVPLAVASIGASGDYRDPQGSWAKLRQVDEDGAILVRPDNHVAWRAAAAQTDPTLALTSAFKQALGQGDD
ncbi:MAG: 2,4-dichlorophenol 6-monooxygenase, partial [Salinisphaera sp.]|nr:2,4-dichlorophenol 6-monooxygenase [Salinisphaera sp.]